jgi:hypothetical protein
MGLSISGSVKEKLGGRIPIAGESETRTRFTIFPPASCIESHCFQFVLFREHRRCGAGEKWRSYGALQMEKPGQ